MAHIDFTPQQESAVTACGQSVIVSAAAGSGKTAVLAERCAYLVCDAPPNARCGIDELLVVTFTEAAAAEMRSRIVDALRERAERKPADRRLREQVALADAASISTVHAFCQRIIRRWFTEADIDPAASLMDENEAALLRRDVLEELFKSLYPPQGPPNQLLGSTETDRTENSAATDGDSRSGGLHSQSFVHLIDVYGLSDDRNIATLVMKLSDFVSSLTDPDRWLRESREAVSTRAGWTVLAHLRGMMDELARQGEHTAQMATRLRAGPDAAQHHAAQIADYADQLAKWLNELQGCANGIPSDDEVTAQLAAFDGVRAQIESFSFSTRRAPLLPKDAPQCDRDARDAASDAFKTVKATLFQKRLRARYGLFSIDESIEGVRRSAPFVETLTRLVAAFRGAYASRKRQFDLLDFNDLERLAYSLLTTSATDSDESPAARSLRDKYKYVLIDEFQDINPIQQAIIRQVSREPDSARADNLFVVGDVKQSIYRFRLAEPALFTERWRSFRKDETKGRAIPLQMNFRSRPEILNTVNTIFRHLMGEGSDTIAYDAEAELIPRSDVDFGSRTVPVELHLVERAVADTDGQDDTPEPGTTNVRDPARWSPIEREGYLIGSLIQSWQTNDLFGNLDRPLQYSDIAILLRASRINAARIAGMLADLGIPCFANAGGSLLGSREVRDVWAALQVLDNPQQDIPLAAVLRSGILGESLNEDALVEIRCLDRTAAFHDVVRRYPATGGNANIAEKLKTLWARIEQLRNAARRRPLADALWSLYDREGFLGYTSGLPNGLQRRANLLKLHELARKFGTFRQQGLHRFLRFVESLEEQDRDIAAAPAIGEGDDVVRIMSIHQSKGLEFPIVFVAGLGTRFNLGDRSGRIIFERSAKLGLRVVDTDRMIEYPSAAHARVAAEVEYHTRDEEARILYVAMTRAREKLVLIGSTRNATSFRETPQNGTSLPLPTRHSLVTANAPLDWLIPALSTAPDGTVTGLFGKSASSPIVTGHIHDATEIAGWSLKRDSDKGNDQARQAVAKMVPLPPQEPIPTDDFEAGEIIDRTEFVYPHLASGSHPAVAGASAFKGKLDYTANPEERAAGTDRVHLIPTEPPVGARMPRSESIERGLLNHRVLEHLDFSKADGEQGVASELQRLVVAGVLRADERPHVDVDAIAWFVTTPLGDAIRSAGKDYRREFSFIATEPTEFFDATIGRTTDDKVLVRGIVDGILLRSDGIEIVDFKTDTIDAAAVPGRVERYRPQMMLYARAMTRLWRKPVTACRLVFLTARHIADVGGLEID